MLSTHVRVSVCRRCVEAMPADTDERGTMIPSLKNGKDLPQVCQDAWGTDPMSGSLLDHLVIMSGGITKSMLSATAESYLHKALWELPCSCRRLNFPGDAEQEYFCPDTDTNATCDLSDQTIAQLYSHALSDTSKQATFGCGQQTFGGEHMQPYMPNLYQLGRLDLLMRLEDVDDEEPKFEEWITKNAHVAMKPMKENCTFGGVAGNVGDEGVNQGLFNPDHLKDVFAKSADLQRRTCAMFWSDYVCSAYDLPTACQDPDSWMEETFAKIFDNAPVELDGKMA